MGKQFLDKDGLQVAVNNVKEAKEIAAGAMALAQQAMESGGQDIYSTTETKTNKVWIDGKPIYRTVVDFGALPNNTTKHINTTITGVETVTDYKGIALNSAGSALCLPFIPDNGSNNYSISLFLDALATGIYIWTGMDRSAFTRSYVTIEYTKTTN